MVGKILDVLKLPPMFQKIDYKYVCTVSHVSVFQKIDYIKLWFVKCCAVSQSLVQNVNCLFLCQNIDSKMFFLEKQVSFCLRNQFHHKTDIQTHKKLTKMF